MKRKPISTIEDVEALFLDENQRIAGDIANVGIVQVTKRMFALGMFKTIRANWGRFASDGPACREFLTVDVITETMDIVSAQKALGILQDSYDYRMDLSDNPPSRK